MKTILKFIDERVWNSVEYGWEKPTTPVSEWQTFEKEAVAFNSIAMNAIYNANDECFDEFYTKLNDIVNSAYNLGEIYD